MQQCIKIDLAVELYLPSNKHVFSCKTQNKLCVSTRDFKHTFYGSLKDKLTGRALLWRSDLGA